MDGLGDACDSDTCDPSIGPIFSVTSETDTSITGQVEDCAGITSLDLTSGLPRGLPGNNLQLTVLSGGPGDPVWTFEITLVDPTQPGMGTLVANGVAMTTNDFVIDLGGTTGPGPGPGPSVIEVPTASDWGLGLLALLLAGAGLLAVRRV